MNSSSLDVLVIAGGWSPEREVSLKGARLIASELHRRGHRVTLFDLSEGLDALLEQASAHQVAFLNLHGAPGEDGLVQAILEQAGCPYQGSGPAGSFLALHKAAAKSLFRRAGLLTPDWLFLPAPPAPDWTPTLPFPLFAKANRGGSSLHLYRASDRAELDRALEALFALGEEVLLEPLIAGREVTCGVLDTEPSTGHSLERGKALPPVLILPKNQFFDFHDKYAPDGAEEICPAPLDDAVTEAVQRAALAAHRGLGLSGYSRADFILSPEGLPYLLEVNTLPGMTAASLLPKEAAAAGIAFGELLERLLEHALHKH